jgi:hypothetical protein
MLAFLEFKILLTIEAFLWIRTKIKELVSGWRVGG